MPSFLIKRFAKPKVITADKRRFAARSSESLNVEISKKSVIDYLQAWEPFQIAAFRAAIPYKTNTIFCGGSQACKYTVLGGFHACNWWLRSVRIIICLNLIILIYKRTQFISCQSHYFCQSRYLLP